MTDKPPTDVGISRRTYLAGTGVSLLAAINPGLAKPPRTGPTGHRRAAPVFRRVDLDK
ncbi:MAG: hypothetical protein ABIM50_00470 [Novosphingobium sp.]